jgi:hypothetical protein
MSEKRNPYGLTSPCDNCPFRSDVKPYIRAARVREIERSLVRSEFPCHKTMKHEDDGEEGSVYVPSGGEIHCAGALILMEKEGRSSQMMRISGRLGLYDPSKLKMDAPVYDSFSAMHAAAKASETERAKPAKSKRKPAPKLTAEQRRKVKEKVVYEGCTRAEAVAWVLAQRGRK